MKMLYKTTYQAIVFFQCVLLWFTSCSNETEIGGGHRYTGEKVVLNIQMEVRDAADPDLEITGVRAIVFSGEGKLVYNGAPAPTTDSTDGTPVVKVKAAHGVNHVYIICNETEELAGKLSAVESRDAIESITFNAVGITGAPPMYGKVEDAYVEARSDGSKVTVTVGGTKSTELPVKVTRMVARIGFTAIKNVDTSTQEDFKVTKLSVRVCRMPVETTIGEGKTYDEDAWSDDLLMEQTGLLDNNGAYDIDNTTIPSTYIVPAGVNSIVLPDTYIPENLLSVPSDASRATYLKIEAECQMKDGSTQILHGIYLLNIGQSSSTINYNLPRNNYFHIYATITGLGALGIYAEIVAMEEHDITINWKPIDGLVIVSDKSADFDFDNDTSKNVNVWDDYNVYSGILKTYHSETGYKDVVFKQGSLIAVQCNRTEAAGTAFVPPASNSELNDILWYPGSYDAAAITGWSAIPYRQTGDIPTDNTVEEVTKALGDPCKLVGLSSVQIDNGIVDNGLWHMATTEKYNVLITAADGVSYDDGYGTFHYLLLPYASYRDENGTTARDASKGHFWTAASATAFITDGSSGTIADSQEAQCGYTVRCVRNTIPGSMITVARVVSVDYQGNSNGKPALTSITSNVPYWKAELVTSGNDVGFDDFSFEPGETSVHTMYGKFSQDIPVYIKRKNSQSMRNFAVKVEGMGLDGQMASKQFTVSQAGFKYVTSTTFNPVIVNNMIPRAGETYSVTVGISPTDVPVPTGNLLIRALYQGNELGRSQEVTLQDGVYTYSGLSITIPENKTPDIINLDLEIYVVQNSYWTLLGKRSLTQSNK